MEYRADEKGVQREREACVENIGDSWKKPLSWRGHTPLKACEEEREWRWGGGGGGGGGD